MISFKNFLKEIKLRKLLLIGILDSGATENMCSQKEKFIGSIPLKSEVEIANSKKN